MELPIHRKVMEKFNLVKKCWELDFKIHLYSALNRQLFIWPTIYIFYINLFLRLHTWSSGNTLLLFDQKICQNIMAQVQKRHKMTLHCICIACQNVMNNMKKCIEFNFNLFSNTLGFVHSLDIGREKCVWETL